MKSPTVTDHSGARIARREAQTLWLGHGLENEPQMPELLEQCTGGLQSESVTLAGLD
jgi:hypothetical protein